MKNTISFVIGLLILVQTCFGQHGSADSTKSKSSKPEHHSIGIGIKAGVNFANVTNASSISSSNETGFHAGIIYAPPSKSIISSSTELLFSRQGYNYASGNNTGTVNLDYIILQQLMCINITKFVSIQLGAQFAYLINAKADSSQQYNTGNATANEILSYYNRYDYGFGGGIEVHPFMGLLVGARYNISLNNLYKEPTSFPSGGIPSFIPSTSSINLKNNLVQLYAGWRF
ncbi:MAG TPA: outer membrane beta-barrel protein [Puia sp.]|nr:outer membrane beta-barrel protein [Puia sp.]